MIRVRRSVMDETGGQQVPWEEAALNEGFAFAEGPAVSIKPSAKPGSQARPATASPVKKGTGAPSLSGGTGF
jgi:uncharacterized caspase-like protein